MIFRFFKTNILYAFEYWKIINNTKHDLYILIRLTFHEKVYLVRLCFERYFSQHCATLMIISCIFKENMWT